MCVCVRGGEVVCAHVCNNVDAHMHVCIHGYIFFFMWYMSVSEVGRDSIVVCVNNEACACVSVWLNIWILCEY